jgi:hypothetical protein
MRGFEASQFWLSELNRFGFPTTIADEEIAVLKAQLGMALDRQFFKPVISPCTNLTPGSDEPDPPALVDSSEILDTDDQAATERQIKAETEAEKALAVGLEKQFAEKVMEQAEAHA